jgi:hypothetical protein
LRWLFLAEGALMPEHPSVRIVLEENGEVVDRV